MIINDIKHSLLRPFESLWRKGRSEEFFVAEGFRFTELALQSPLHPLLCLATPEFAEQQSVRWAALKALAPSGLAFVLVSERIFARFAATQNPQGVLAILARPAEQNADDFLSERAGSGAFRCFVLENVQDPGNVGSIVRTAEALGFDALFYTSGTAQPFSPKALRAAMGSTLFLPNFLIDQLSDFLLKLKNMNILTLAAALNGEKITAVEPVERLAILIGNEGEGLSEEALAGAAKSARIPMSGRADSLNAAAAAAIMAYALKGD